jgi:hypothetical protein
VTDATLTAAQARAWRVARHRLDARAPREALVDVAGVLCGVHAQLQSSAELALWARVEGLRPGDVDRALWEERSLVKLWAMRGTLHLLPAAELGRWSAALGTRERFRTGVWFRSFDITPEELDRLVDEVGAVLRDRILTRAELAAEVAERTGSDHLRAKLEESFGAYLKPAAARGELCFAPSAGQNVRFTHPATWVGGLETADPDDALDEVTRRYLHAYGPADREDFARWWGIPSPARALERIRRLGDAVVEVEVGGRRGFMLAEDAAQVVALDPPATVALLPAFDPYVAGSSRADTDVLAAEHKARVHRPQGWISPVLLVDGRIAGVWRHERKGDRIEVEIEPFGALADETRDRAEAHARDLAAFLGGDLALRFAA